MVRKFNSAIFRSHAGIAAILRDSLRASVLRSAWMSASFAVSFIPADAAMTWEQKCEAVAGIAKNVMIKYQNRVPLEKSLHAYDNIGIPEFRDILRRIVLEAYDGPRYSTPKHQQNAAQDYADRTLLSCLKAG